MAGDRHKNQSSATNVYDLFGEIPVTWDEVWLWVEMVAGLPRDSWRAANYVRWWNVPEKIRWAKLSGDWPPESRRTCHIGLYSNQTSG